MNLNKINVFTVKFSQKGFCQINFTSLQSENDVSIFVYMYSFGFGYGSGSEVLKWLRLRRRCQKLVILAPHVPKTVRVPEAMKSGDSIGYEKCPCGFTMRRLRLCGIEKCQCRVIVVVVVVATSEFTKSGYSGSGSGSGSVGPEKCRLLFLKGPKNCNSGAKEK